MSFGNVFYLFLLWLSAVFVELCSYSSESSIISVNVFCYNLFGFEKLYFFRNLTFYLIKLKDLVA